MMNNQRNGVEKINLIEEGKKIGINEVIKFHWMQFHWVQLRWEYKMNDILLAGDKFMPGNAFKTTRIYVQCLRTLY